MLEIFNAAIRTRLLATSAITSQLSGTAAIYNSQAPVNVNRPYIIFQYMAGGDFNDTPRRAVDLRYMIKGVAVSGATADAIAAAIEAELRGKSLTLSGSVRTYSVQHLTPLSMVENDQQTQIYHVGGIYRIRAVY